MKLLILIALQLLQLCVASKRNLRSSRRLNAFMEPCTLLTKIHRDKNGIERAEMKCQLEGQDAINNGELMVSIEGVTLEWATANNVVSGVTTLFVEGATIEATDDGYILVLPETVSGTNNFILDTPETRRRRLAGTTGDQSILVVRVIATDSQTSSSEDVLSNKIFGTGGDPVNLVSQYKACSNDQLRFYPTGDSIANKGVYTVNIGRSVRNKSETQVEDIVTSKLEETLGNSFGNRYDHVMYCLPEGTAGGAWVGYAYVNHWLSIFNDKWCERVSGQMHEMGHNLGLAHSGESNGYDDTSGLMGFSYYEDDGPKMCFNGAKSWQLGWYSDRHATATPNSGAWNGVLTSVEYSRGRTGNPVILKVVGDNTYDYYVNYNQQTGRNVGTKEGQNQVLVTRREKGDHYAASTLVAKLNQGGSYSDNSFGGETMTIRANSINGPIASISVTSSGGGGGGTTYTAPCSSHGGNYAVCMNNNCSWDGHYKRCF